MGGNLCRFMLLQFLHLNNQKQVLFSLFFLFVVQGAAQPKY